MPSNPFRRKSRVERAREKAEELAGRAAQAREQAAAAAAEADRLAEPVPDRLRGPLRLVAIAVGAVAIVYVWRRVTRPSGSSGLAEPDVTPTAPAGPTEPTLNDPALKAKVESELFAGESEVSKGRVSVGVADGIVTLRGTLDSVEQTTTLSRAAEQIEGVRGVENLLSVEGS